jgi:hypothetical protein
VHTALKPSYRCLNGFDYPDRARVSTKGLRQARMGWLIPSYSDASVPDILLSTISGPRGPSSPHHLGVSLTFTPYTCVSFELSHCRQAPGSCMCLWFVGVRGGRAAMDPKGRKQGNVVVAALQGSSRCTQKNGKDVGITDGRPVSQFWRSQRLSLAPYILPNDSR